MKRAPIPGPRFGADPYHDTEPPLSLRDIVDALCCGLNPAPSALEAALDRIEGACR
ncbi:hypothetical protein [Thioclava pacifica]|uniref:Uncharacterized protein n=1 Tax=Thioclava pacifica DSM 10166 TaxID=1353537 RepID=A0A074JBE1_9RHOB|nr:hypothetical protein [Thioclava pacifica]KEO52903.1 hypothetical protein TP2_08155 [Thioclava pacifica DSM 10166]